MFRRLKIKWLVWRGKAVDIWSKSAYPADVLSNLCNNSFCFDGIACGSMEGFLQSLKYKDTDKQRQICGMPGKEAKKMSVSDWQRDHIVWWKGRAIDRLSKTFIKHVKRAYWEMFIQNKHFRAALTSTRGMKIFHSKGVQDPCKTILTEQEFCDILIKTLERFDRYYYGPALRLLTRVDYSSFVTQLIERNYWCNSVDFVGANSQNGKLVSFGIGMLPNGHGYEEHFEYNLDVFMELMADVVQAQMNTHPLKKEEYSVLYQRLCNHVENESDWRSDGA